MACAVITERLPAGEGEKVPGFQNVRVTTETRDSLAALKRHVSAQANREFSMGDIVSMLVKLGDNRAPELIRIAKES
jgi:hypothetical protein